jgi:hypothetical protein
MPSSELRSDGKGRKSAGPPRAASEKLPRNPRRFAVSARTVERDMSMGPFPKSVAFDGCPVASADSGPHTRGSYTTGQAVRGHVSSAHITSER